MFQSETTPQFYELFTDRHCASEQHHGQQYHAEQSSDDFNGEHGMTFHVGMKVVCIRTSHDGFINLADGAKYGLRIGAIYVVTRINNDTNCIGVSDIVGGWCKSRFRPIVERKTSIEIFTAMLTPKKQGVDA